MSCEGHDPLTGRSFALPVGWVQHDSMTFVRNDGAKVWRDARRETTQPIWWRAADSQGMTMRGRAGMTRGYRRPESAMAAVENHEPQSEGEQQ